MNLGCNYFNLLSNQLGRHIDITVQYGSRPPIRVIPVAGVAAITVAPAKVSRFTGRRRFLHVADEL